MWLVPQLIHSLIEICSISLIENGMVELEHFEKLRVVLFGGRGKCIG